MAKQFTLGQRAGDGSAIDCGEVFAVAFGIQAVDRLSQDLFTGSGLALNQNGDVADQGSSP